MLPKTVNETFNNAMFLSWVHTCVYRNHEVQILIRIEALTQLEQLTFHDVFVSYNMEAKNQYNHKVRRRQ